MFEDKVIPLDIWVSQFVDWLVDNHRDFFQTIKWPVEQTLNGLDAGLNWLSSLIVIALPAFAAWRFSGKRLAVFTIITMTIIGLLCFWGDTMTTLAMVLSSVIFCALVGIPFGVFAGRSDAFETGIRPLMDAMQTTPAFVYLVPIVMLFSVGNVAGVPATIVFALPPLIRLTSLGIRQVHPELVEAAQAFGATNWQVLIRVQVPLNPGRTEPDHHDGVVHGRAALIGAGGLGSPVILGLNTLDIGLAVIGGLSIVLMAIVLDRLTQSMALKKK